MLKSTFPILQHKRTGEFARLGATKDVVDLLLDWADDGYLYFSVDQKTKDRPAIIIPRKNYVRGLKLYSISSRKDKDHLIDLTLDGACVY